MNTSAPAETDRLIPNCKDQNNGRGPSGGFLLFGVERSPLLRLVVSLRDNRFLGVFGLGCWHTASWREARIYARARESRVNELGSAIQSAHAPPPSRPPPMPGVSMHHYEK